MRWIQAAIGGVMACFAAQLLGCGSMYGATDADLNRRAAFDLNCPEPQLEKTELGDDTYGVTGCGRRATYVSACSGQPGNLFTTCKWVLNNEQADPRGAGAPPATPASAPVASSAPVAKGSSAPKKAAPRTSWP